MPLEKTSTNIDYPWNAIPVKGYFDIPEKLIGSDFFFFNPDKYQSDETYRTAVTNMADSVKPKIGGMGVAKQSAGVGAVVPQTKERSISQTPPQTSSSEVPPAARDYSKAAIGTMAGASMVGDVANQMKQAGVNDYLMDVNYWNQQGKWWFDKNAEYAPTFEEYVGDMPSAKDAVSPVATTIGRTAQGAAAGTAIAPGVGTAIGAGVGALVGVVESIFSWDSAEEQDAKNKERALNEYKKQLKEWTYARNRRFADERARITGEYHNFIRGANEQAKAIKQQQAHRKEGRRQQMVDSFLSAGNVAKKKRAEKIAIFS